VKRLLFALVALAYYTSALATLPQHLVESRYCGTPVRDANGEIQRSRLVLKEFQKIHPCPSTGLTTGACPGWALNHTIPLACGGCDSVSNLDWMPDEIKSCAEPWCRDRWERKVYDHDPSFDGTENCKNVIVQWGN